MDYRSIEKNRLRMELETIHAYGEHLLRQVEREKELRCSLTFKHIQEGHRACSLYAVVDNGEEVTKTFINTFGGRIEGTEYIDGLTQSRRYAATLMEKL